MIIINMHFIAYRDGHEAEGTNEQMNVEIRSF
jgi:hypothetical protein